MLGEFKSLYDLMNAFPNDYYCEQHLEKIRWNGYVVSPFDETSKVYKCKNGNIDVKTLVNTLMFELVQCLIILKSPFKNGL